jgi:hypothetical protein
MSINDFGFTALFQRKCATLQSRKYGRDFAGARHFEPEWPLQGRPNQGQPGQPFDHVRIEKADAPAERGTAIAMSLATITLQK